MQTRGNEKQSEHEKRKALKLMQKALNPILDIGRLFEGNWKLDP